MEIYREIDVTIVNGGRMTISQRYGHVISMLEFEIHHNVGPILNHSFLVAFLGKLSKSWTLPEIHFLESCVVNVVPRNMAINDLNDEGKYQFYI